MGSSGGLCVCSTGDPKLLDCDYLLYKIKVYRCTGQGFGAYGPLCRGCGSQILGGIWVGEGRERRPGPFTST